MKENLYGSETKMGDLLSAEPGLVHTLQRVGLTLGFGDRSVGQVCAARGVDTDFFLLLCNIYAHEGHVPGRQRVLDTPMRQLVPYLRLSHAYYVDKRLPHIEQHLHHIAAHLSAGAAAALVRFFDLYKSEVAAHFAHEEQRVYPHVEALQRGERDTTYSIAHFVENHGDLEDKLGELVQIIFKYLPEEATTDDAVDVVYDILQLSEDLHKHSMIEEKVLVPYVQHLEERLGR